jgi:hypothetical protein
MKQNYGAEQHGSLYPISAETWFAKDPIHRTNLATVRELAGGPYAKVLDWGCGNLLWSLALFPGAEITGVEASDECLRYCTLNAEHAEVKFTPVRLAEVSLPANYFDAGLTMSLTEFLSPEQFELVYSSMYKALVPGAPLIVTLHNWRALSALYVPWLFRGGYESCCRVLGARISRRKLRDVLSDFRRIGFEVRRSGAYNPYPAKLWRYLRPSAFYKTENMLLAHWYCTQFAVLQKPKEG